MVGRIRAPKEVHIRVLGTCEFVKLQGKGELSSDPTMRLSR